MVRCGGSFVIAQAEDGTLYGWGDGRKGQLGNGRKKQVAQPEALGWTPPCPVADIVCGNENTLFLLEDGTVWTCGSNSYGQQGIPGGHLSTPARIQGLEKIVQVACGFGHNLALDSEGRVYAWGRGGNGQLGLGDKKNRETPQQVPVPGAVCVACGGKYSMVMDREGTLYGFGENAYGQLGPGRGNILEPRVLELFGKDRTITALALGGDTAYALDASGALWSWGRNDYYQTGDPQAGKSTEVPVRVPLPEGITPGRVIAYSGHTAVLTDTGGLIQWGHVSCGVRGCLSSPFRGLPNVIHPESGVADMDNGSLFVCILLEDGRVLTSGDNEYHQLGVRRWKAGQWSDTGLNLKNREDDTE